MSRINRFWDTPARYGVVSRMFHWFMAYLLLWQFLMAMLWVALGDTALVRQVAHFGPSHTTIGIFVIALIAPRIVLSLASRKRRPTRERSLLGWLVRTMHGLLYLLMIVIPARALLRAYGSGEGFIPWGLQLVPATRRENLR